MRYLSKLSDDDIDYICTAISYKDTVDYFTRYPKEFSKIRHGFRPKTLTKLEVSKLLFDNYHSEYISSFIEKNIKNSITIVEKYYSEFIKNGSNHENALLFSLAKSIFANNILVFFKLKDQSFETDYIELMSSSIQTIGELQKTINELEKSKKDIEVESRKLDRIIKKQHIEYDNLELKLSNKISELKVLRQLNTRLEKQTNQLVQKEQLINELKMEKSRLLKSSKKLEEKLAQLQDNFDSLIETKQSNLQNEEKLAKRVVQSYRKPKRPVDMEEFQEYFSYNLENMGLDLSEVYSKPFLHYLSRIIFSGRPIVTNHNVGINIARCLSNAIFGTSSFDILTFKENIQTEEIRKYIDDSERLVLLDNFLGNFNETELIPIISEYRNKIIIMTIMYEGTLRYISGEFFKYCYYLNANRAHFLNTPKVLTEDPSKIIEVEYNMTKDKKDNRFNRTYSSILHEVGFSNTEVELRIEDIVNNETINQSLLFDLFPYCLDVLSTHPLVLSDSLSKFLLLSSNSTYYQIFESWFK